MKRHKNSINRGRAQPSNLMLSLNEGYARIPMMFGAVTLLLIGYLIFAVGIPWNTVSDDFIVDEPAPYERLAELDNPRIVEMEELVLKLARGLRSEMPSYNPPSTRVELWQGSALTDLLNRLNERFPATSGGFVTADSISRQGETMLYTVDEHATKITTNDRQFTIGGRRGIPHTCSERALDRSDQLLAADLRYNLKCLISRHLWGYLNGLSEELPDELTLLQQSGVYAAVEDWARRQKSITDFEIDSDRANISLELKIGDEVRYLHEEIALAHVNRFTDAAEEQADLRDAVIKATQEGTITFIDETTDGRAYLAYLELPQLKLALESSHQLSSPSLKELAFVNTYFSYSIGEQPSPVQPSENIRYREGTRNGGMADPATVTPADNLVLDVETWDGRESWLGAEPTLFDPQPKNKKFFADLRSYLKSAGYKVQPKLIIGKMRDGDTDRATLIKSITEPLRKMRRGQTMLLSIHGTPQRQAVLKRFPGLVKKNFCCELLRDTLRDLDQPTAHIDCTERAVLGKANWVGGEPKFLEATWYTESSGSDPTGACNLSVNHLLYEYLGTKAFVATAQCYNQPPGTTIRSVMDHVGGLNTDTTNIPLFRKDMELLVTDLQGDNQELIECQGEAPRPANEPFCLLPQREELVGFDLRTAQSSLTKRESTGINRNPRIGAHAEVNQSNGLKKYLALALNGSPLTQVEFNPTVKSIDSQPADRILEIKFTSPVDPNSIVVEDLGGNCIPQWRNPEGYFSVTRGPEGVQIQFDSTGYPVNLEVNDNTLNPENSNPNQWEWYIDIALSAKTVTSVPLLGNQTAADRFISPFSNEVHYLEQRLPKSFPRALNTRGGLMNGGQHFIMRIPCIPPSVCCLNNRYPTRGPAEHLPRFNGQKCLANVTKAQCGGCYGSCIGDEEYSEGVYCSMILYETPAEDGDGTGHGGWRIAHNSCGDGEFDFDRLQGHWRPWVVPDGTDAVLRDRPDPCPAGTRYHQQTQTDLLKSWPLNDVNTGGTCEPREYWATCEGA